MYEFERQNVPNIISISEPGVRELWRQANNGYFPNFVDHSHAANAAWEEFLTTKGRSIVDKFYL